MSSATQRRSPRWRLTSIRRSGPCLPRSKFGYFGFLPQGFEIEQPYLIGARGIILSGRGRHQEAIQRLEEALPQLAYQGYMKGYFLAALALSRSWSALGRPERSVAVLEEASRQKVRAFWGRYYWITARAELAARYRALGRLGPAGELEAELRGYCARADPDYPILKALESPTPRRPQKQSLAEDLKATAPLRSKAHRRQ